MALRQITKENERLNMGCFYESKEFGIYRKNNPVTKEEIDFVENHINGELPKVYKEFLRYANGMVMNLCVLYDTKSIIENYECNEFAEYKCRKGSCTVWIFRCCRNRKL